VKGAFTGAFQPRPGKFREAEGGTLFLDEIGDMPMEMQAKIFPLRSYFTSGWEILLVPMVEPRAPGKARGRERSARHVRLI
jgi:hypothetical protein